MASLAHPHAPDAAETVCHRVAPTPFGLAAVAASGQGICWLALGDDADALIGALRRRWPGARAWSGGVGRDGELLAAALQSLERPAEVCELPLDLRGTPFQLAVWAQLRRIPAGVVISYTELARRVGRPRAFRAAAAACGANPVGVLVPCHRVIASDGGLGGFGFGVAIKRELLRREGVAL